MKWGPYTLLSLLRQGSGVVVHEALDERRGQRVALLRPDAAIGPTDEAAVRRFQREAKALALVRHTHLIEVLDFAQVDGAPYLALAPVEGPTLRSLIANNERPDPRALCAGMAGIADALHALHRAGLLHGAVSASSVTLTNDDGYVLHDFGSSCPLYRSVNGTGAADSLVGKPVFMSPEQLLQPLNALDGRTDVYQVGAVLYWGLTSQPPITAQGPATLMRKALKRRPKPPHRLNRAVPRDISRIVSRCLRKDPLDRYANAAELASALRTVAT